MSSVAGIDDGSGFGVKGESPTGSGVVGVGPTWAGVVANSVSGSGVSTFSESGAGVLSVSNTGPAVSGQSVHNVGVVGRSDDAAGVAGSSLSGVGISGDSRLTNGVLGLSQAGSAAGVFGRDTATEDGVGVVGLAEGLSAIGVFGESANTQRGGTGVVGHAGPAGIGVVALGGGRGVAARGDTGPGVDASSGSDCGVVGRAEQEGFAGVLGQCNAGMGVAGLSDTGTGLVGRSGTGVGASTESTDNDGMVGRSASGAHCGVRGENPSGIGVKGVSNTLGVVAEAGGVAFSPAVAPLMPPGPLGAALVSKGNGAYIEGQDGLGAYVAGKNMGMIAAAENIAVWALANTGPTIWAAADKGHAILATSVEQDCLRAIVTQLGIAVHGTATNANAPSTYAGMFDGDVNVNGTLRKTSNKFLIDHPLDPEGKYLEHSAVESSEMKNVYDGTAMLDKKGRTVVRLPKWFSALNEDFRYQLTAIGQPAPDLHVAQELTDNRFVIAGGPAGGKVCWQITGNRCDAWARVNPMRVESRKPRGEKGLYLYPELHGAPKSASIIAARNAKATATLGRDVPPTREAGMAIGAVRPSRAVRAPQRAGPPIAPAPATVPDVARLVRDLRSHAGTSLNDRRNIE